MTSETERAVTKIGCANLTPQENYRLAWHLVELGRAEGIDISQRWIDSLLLQNHHVTSLPKETLLAAASLTPPAEVALPESYGDALPIKETPCSG